MIAQRSRAALSDRACARRLLAQGGRWLVGATLIALGTAMVGCAPSAQPERAQGENPAAETRPARTLQMVSYGEPPHFGTKFASSSGEGGGGGARAPFVETLVKRDAHGISMPVLAEKVPEISTDSW